MSYREYELWCRDCGYPSRHNVREATCPVCKVGVAVYIGHVDTSERRS
jgi:rubrerythrin